MASCNTPGADKPGRFFIYPGMASLLETEHMQRTTDPISQP